MTRPAFLVEPNTSTGPGCLGDPCPRCQTAPDTEEA